MASLLFPRRALTVTPLMVRRHNNNNNNNNTNNNLLRHKSMAATAESGRDIRGIIFDMDGTLTMPVLDFQGVRNKLGVSRCTDILAYAASKPPVQREQIYKLIHEWEEEGITKMELRPYLFEVLHYLQQSNIHIAILTRNNQRAVDAFLAKLLQDGQRAGHKFANDGSDIFSVVLTRDFVPYKPDPAPARHICSVWDVAEENVMLVGDDVQDVECGRNAGNVTTLVNKPGNEKVRHLAHFNIDCLSHLIHILQSPANLHTSS